MVSDENEELLNSLVEQLDMDADEAEDEVQDRVEEFEGMVSEEGAIHLVAKQHGIQLQESGGQELKAENVVPEMRQADLKGRVVSVGDVTEFDRDDGESGKVVNLTLGDETGTVRMSLWDEQVEMAEKIDEGDTIEIAGAYTVEDNQGNAELRLGDDAKVRMVDEDEVGEVQQSSSGGAQGQPSEVMCRGVMNENTNYTLKGMVVAVYTSSPFYRVDPESGESVRENDDGEHITDSGKVVENPGYRLAVPAVIDDGTDNIRAIFFQERAKQLLDLEGEDVGGDHKAIEEAVDDAIGKRLRITGRSSFNDYFGRIEIIANEVEEINTEQEIENLVDELEA